MEDKKKAYAVILVVAFPAASMIARTALTVAANFKCTLAYNQEVAR